MNRYKPHMLVLPEDDANRQIANGFLLEPAVRARSVQVLPPAGGWIPARDRLRELLAEMSTYAQRVMVLLVDFDGRAERRSEILAHVPPALLDRVFVLGTYSEPEALRGDLGAFEAIGRALARDCVASTTHAWGHGLLAHNTDEATRLLSAVRSFLFD